MNKQIYDNLKNAYDYYNETLFDNGLPGNVIVTIQSATTFKGYYAENKYVEVAGDNSYHEICLNSAVFDKGDDKVLSTLVHEMVHLWHSEYGTPSRWGYHNKEWGNKMIDIGFNPICEGVVGKKSGKACTHEIIPGGEFDIVTKKLVSTNQLFYFHDRYLTIEENGKVTKPTNPKGKKPGLNNKITYKCPKCLTTIYGKQDINVLCITCNKKFIEKENLK